MNIKNLGRSFVKTTIFKSNKLYTSNKCAFIRIDVCHYQARSKIVKLILDISDVKVLLDNKEYNYENCLN